MSTAQRWLIFILVSIIIILSFIDLRLTSHQAPTSDAIKEKQGLLSPRVYAGLLKPQSYLILNYDPLKEVLQSYINENNLNLSIYVVNLRDGASMNIKASTSFPPASMHKVPIAILVAQDIEERKLNWTTMIPINDADRSSSWGELYKTTAKELPVRVLFEKMLRESDNTAFMALGEQIKTEDYDHLISDYLGYFSSKVEGNKENPLISPRSMYSIFSSLYLSTILQPNDSEYILSLLTNTSFDIHSFAHLPADVIVAQKFGENYEHGLQTFNDCGIMYVREMKVFYCLMSNGIPQEKAASTAGYIVSQIYQFTVQARDYFDNRQE